MRKVQIFSTPLCERHLVSRLSLGYIFSLGCTIFAIIVPFLACHSAIYGTDDGSKRSEGLWLKRDTYREQPSVHFNYKVIFVAQAKDASNGSPKELYFSTISSINNLRSADGSLRMASVTSREADDDFDGIVDRLYIQASLPLESHERVFGVKALIFLDYSLTKHVKIGMESVAYIHHDSGIQGDSFTTRGDIVLRQNVPIGVRDNPSIIFSGEPLVDFERVSSHSNAANILSILEKYESRVVSADYVQRFPSWKRDLSYLQENRTFTLKATIDIPKMQEVVFIPTLQEILLDAWIRYLSVFILCLFLVRKICSFVYANRIIPTETKIDYKVKYE